MVSLCKNEAEWFVFCFFTIESVSDFNISPLHQLPTSQDSDSSKNIYYEVYKCPTIIGPTTAILRSQSNLNNKKTQMVQI